MTRKADIESGVKGTIEAHTEIGSVPVAFGYEEKPHRKIGIAYIYNIPQSVVSDKNYLKAITSKNGGKSPTVATPSPREFVVGFHIPDYDDKDAIYQVCKDTIEEVGLNSKIVTNEQKDTADDAKETTEHATIDLSDSF